MKKKPMESAERRRWRRRLGVKKFFLHFALIVSTLVVFGTSFVFFDDDYDLRIRPQINRAIVQVAQLLPQLEQNEEALRDAYDQMVQSWEKVFNSGDFSLEGGFSSATRNSTDATFEKIVDDTLSWLNRVTKLKVGRDGIVAVVSKETGSIVAHPDEKMVGLKFFDEGDPVFDSESIISVRDIRSWTKPEDVNIEFEMYYPHWASTVRLRGSSERIMRFLNQSIYGGMIAYDDYYIICGIPILEYASSVTVNALIVSLIYLVLMGLFVRWICLVMDIRRETSRSMRNKLTSYAVLGCAVLFAVTCYIQILSNVTNDLKTMGKHADAAVETLNTYEEQRERLNTFLDGFYTIQCEIAAALIDSDGADKLTWQDMQRYADALKIKYVYLFDKKGSVVVTNAPYDHLQVGDDPEDFTFQFRRVMEGVEHIVLEPLQDEWLGEYVQYVAESRRDADNKCDGFVLIGVDPALRDRLLEALQVNTVIDNMIIGLPEHAIAVDRETLKIVASTDFGYKGVSIEDLGITEDMLLNDFSGFLKIDGTDYYAGVSMSSDYFLIPIVRRTGNLSAVILSLKIALVALACSLVIILMTLFRYQKVVIDSWPEEGESSEDVSEEDAPEAEAVSKEEAASKAEAVSKTESGGRLRRLSKLLKAQEKSGFEERWRMSDIPADERTPEHRIGRSLYRLLLVFCLVILLPTLYANLQGGADPDSMNNLAYVISGNWQKGANIFAFTACVFLLCAMYVVVVLLNQVLYRIAKVSDMRVETVCLLLKNAVKYICVIILVYYGLAQFGVQTQTLLASAGIMSLMISFGAKDLVSDIIAGFFTIFEGSYKVGDFITVGDWHGTVVEIGLRTTKVRFFAETKIFSNSSVRDIINTDGEVFRRVLQAPISYDADLMEVEAILEEELPKMMDKINGLVRPPQYEGVDALADSSVNLCIAIYVKFNYRFSAMRQLAREVKLMFDRRGIEIPYNQLVLHNGDSEQI